MHDDGAMSNKCTILWPCSVIVLGVTMHSIACIVTV